VTGPTKAELRAAYGRTLPDLAGPGIRVLLVGINPGLYTGWSGFHFGRPSNRLWTTLHEAGFTDRRLRPEESDALLAAGIGTTNLVARATARPTS
jgi:TDG/mug DNA glycosylase family protein